MADADEIPTNETRIEKTKTAEELLYEHLNIEEKPTAAVAKALEHDHTLEVKAAHEAHIRKDKAKNLNNHEINPQINQQGKFKHGAKNF